MNYLLQKIYHTDNAAYQTATRNNWMDDLCKELNISRRGDNNWWVTREDFKTDLLRIKKEFYASGKTGGISLYLSKNYSALYRIFRTKKYYKSLLRELGFTVFNYHIRWTFEDCRRESLKYKTKGEWFAGSPGSQHAARKNGWFDELTKHMKILSHPAGYWTFEKCRKESLKYDFPTAWHRGSPKSYIGARNKPWYKKLIKRMTKRVIQNPAGYWTFEKCRKQANKYKVSKRWRENSQGSWTTAYRNGWLPELTKHMIKVKPTGYWTFEKCREESLKYNKVYDWRVGSPSSYVISKREGWLSVLGERMLYKKKPTWGKRVMKNAA